MRPFTCVIVLFAWRAFSQPLVPVLLTPLDNTLNETSGLLMVDGHLWTVLDSGNPHALFEVDPITGDVLRTLDITNATNVDWEDIAMEEPWVYIGDHGNNSGSRTDLRVYRIPLSALQDEGVTDVMADTLRFVYQDQTDFTPAWEASNWDCEALIARNDSLYLFTKNWLNSASYVYAMPADPGDHAAVRLDTLASQGLVTGASLDQATGAIALIGHTSDTYTPFVWRLSGYPQHYFFDGVATRHALVADALQAEGITWVATDSVYLSNEAGAEDPGLLWALDLALADAVTKVDGCASFHMFPNPVDDRLTIESDRSRSIGLVDATGHVVARWSIARGRTVIDVDRLPIGLYTLMMGEGTRPLRVVVAH